jgi:hypothetical protein
MECEFGSDVVVAVDAIDAFDLGRFPKAESTFEQSCLQTVLYYARAEIENIIVSKAHGRAVICDHGTLDCLTYWPGRAKDFFAKVHSSLEEELARYDWVLQIDHHSNPSHEQSPAIFSNSRSFWKLHPRYLSIACETAYSVCYVEVAKVIRKILAGHTYEEIREYLACSAKPTFSEPTPSAEADL